jgi:hypothetical protein
MKKFKSVNNIFGWIIFAISAAVYILTIESTASFWDCGEFIATAFKLEAGHPPGNPMFQMLGMVATLFAGGNVKVVPVTVNIFSALCSAFTILFLFWSITHLARKIIGNKEEYTTGQLIAIIGSGMVGALAYTFSDSFWFSAVEAEVYAASSFFTAIVFWAILKWEDIADEKYANRWLILIAYLMGLSIGVHLLNLLAIPAIALVYYFRKYPVTRNGTVITVLVSFVILAIVLYGIVQGIFVIASWFELLFVNGFGLPFNSGWYFYIILILGLIIWGVTYTAKKGKVLWNTIILCVSVIILGYSSYAMVVIRSNADTPLNENDPSNLFNLLSYLNREQYGDRPLIYGPYYNAPVLDPEPGDNEKGKPIYAEKNGKYEVIEHKPFYRYDSRFKGLFPRMYSREGGHIQVYKEWAKIKGKGILVKNENGEQTIYKPTAWENLKFFVSYQVGYMYLRYFMWNFSGRQNDIQGSSGQLLKGNWITGIKAVDEIRLGSQDKLPPDLKDNKGRNKYYMLPLILGLVGLFFHLQKHKKDFWVVMTLFFMTGLAIVIYLNQTPNQPRERDYAYAGSFYAFAIWIGLGVLGLIDSLNKKIKGALPSVLITIITLGLVPGIMAKENWNDHDRSGRYTARDFAYNYLNSCAPNAILFTNGDNDTFPLWYIQEVEGVRTDVRVVNLSYLGADWYIDQMQRKVYSSDPLPFSMKTIDKYQTGTRDVVYIYDLFNGQYIELQDAMKFVASDLPRTKQLPNSNYQGRVDFIPAKNLMITVDSAQILATGTVRPKFAKSIVPVMKWELLDPNDRERKRYRQAFYKNDMMVLDLMGNNNWKRPVYFAITVSDDNYLNMDKYFQLQGLAYRIIPIENVRPDGQTGSVDSDILYDNLINKFKWGNISDPKVYLDENNLRMLSNFRNTFARLAEQLIDEGKVDSAVRVLDKCIKEMPPQQIPLNLWAIPVIRQYYRAKQIDKANDLTQQLFNLTDADMNYYFRLKGKFANQVENEKQISMYCFNALDELTSFFQQKTLNEKIHSTFQKYMDMMRPAQ